MHATLRCVPFKSFNPTRLAFHSKPQSFGITWHTRIAKFSEQSKPTPGLNRFQKEDPRWLIKSDRDLNIKTIKDEIAAAEAAATENLRGNKYEIARTLNDMGLVFMQTMKHEKAELYLLRAVEILLELKHPFQFQALENLIGYYFQQEQYISGTPWLVKKINAYEKSTEKPGLEQYRNDLWNLSEAYWKVGKFEQCVTYLRKLLQLATADRGEESESVAKVRQELGITLLQLDRFDEALAELQLARVIAHNRHGASHAQFARALALEAQAYLAKGDVASAVKIQKQVLSIREALTPANPLLIALSFSELAASYSRAGDIQSALQSRKKEEEILTKALQSANHPKLASIKKAITHLEQMLSTTKR